MWFCLANSHWFLSYLRRGKFRERIIAYRIIVDWFQYILCYHLQLFLKIPNQTKFDQFASILLFNLQSM